MIIGIAGRKRSGKNTAADVFVARGFDLHSFAEPIRSFVSMLINEEITDKNKEAPLPGLGLSPRQLMQTAGTEWGRAQHPDIWLWSLKQRLPVMAVIHDVRFENEADFIRNAGGIVIHIVRDGLPSDGHASEAGIERKAGDVVIYNNGSLAHFLLKVESAADAILEAHA